MWNKKDTESGAVSSRSGWKRSLRVFRHRNFRLFWLGQLVSLSGTGVQIVALNWLVYRLTDSALALGLVNFAALLPVGVVSLVGGVISDRFSRHRLIVVTQTVLALQALGLTVLTATGSVQVWHIIVITFVAGAANAFGQPAHLGLVMDIVGEEDFGSALAINALLVNGRLLGPAVAGALIGWLGEASCFFVNFLTYLVIIAAYLSMRVDARDAARMPMRFKRDLFDGVKYVWHGQVIRGVLLLIAVSSLLSRPYLVLMPVFARDVLQVGSRGYGLLMSAIGVGAICGTLMAACIEDRHRGPWLLRTAIAFPAFLLLFACSRSMWSSVGLLFLASANDWIQHVLATSMVQLASSEEFRGRVASLFGLVWSGATRLGGVQAGAIAQLCSVSVSIAGGAGLSLLFVLVLMIRMPFTRRPQRSM